MKLLIVLVLLPLVLLSSASTANEVRPAITMVSGGVTMEVEQGQVVTMIDGQPRPELFTVPNGSYITLEEGDLVVYEDQRKDSKILVLDKSLQLEEPAWGPNEWLAYVARPLAIPVTDMYCDWYVPKAPEFSSVTMGRALFYFPAMTDPLTNDGIIQPVLEWNQTTNRGQWTICSWYIGLNFPTITGDRHVVQTDDWIYGRMTYYGYAPNPFWIITTINKTTGDQSVILVDSAIMDCNNLTISTVFESSRGIPAFPEEIPDDAVTFRNITVCNDSRVIKPVWITRIKTELVSLEYGDYKYPNTAWVRIVSGTMPSIEGDANGDCKVDFIDLTILAGSYGSCTGDEAWDSRADFNTDGCIDFADLLVMAVNYGEIC